MNDKIEGKKAVSFGGNIDFDVPTFPPRSRNIELGNIPFPPGGHPPFEEVFRTRDLIHGHEDEEDLIIVDVNGEVVSVSQLYKVLKDENIQQENTEVKSRNLLKRKNK